MNYLIFHVFGILYIYVNGFFACISYGKNVFLRGKNDVSLRPMIFKRNVGASSRGSAERANRFGRYKLWSRTMVYRWHIITHSPSYDEWCGWCSRKARIRSGRVHVTAAVGGRGEQCARNVTTTTRMDNSLPRSYRMQKWVGVKTSGLFLGVQLLLRNHAHCLLGKGGARNDCCSARYNIV
jgi:hypothetical protein